MDEQENRNLIVKFWQLCRNDWNVFAHDALGVNLDKEQRECLSAIQNNNRISIRSGHARGKDYVAAVASCCFLYLNAPSKVVCTAPTGRQVDSIMMSEIKKIHSKTLVPLPGIVLERKIKMPGEADWFLEGFKASEKAAEAWTGYHSPNMMVVVTEASGIEQSTFDAIEGILTGHSKLVIIFNPNRTTGEAYKSTTSSRYHKIKLDCLNAPNVVAKEVLIPGQVDFDWVKDKVNIWCSPIEQEDFGADIHDFEFDGVRYRPNDLFLIKVLAEFPREGENQLIPIAWIDAAVERWKEVKSFTGALRLGCDIAGMGRDNNVFCYRYSEGVRGFDVPQKPQVQPELVHMEMAGRIKNILENHVDSKAFVDTIGEGAGVHSRLKELGVASVSVKFSESADNLKDVTGFIGFRGMRDYCWWAIRDALDPKQGINIALPPIDALVEDLAAPLYEFKSDGKVKIEDKDSIKERLKRSPDWGDSLALTFYPKDSKEYVRFL